VLLVTSIAMLTAGPTAAAPFDTYREFTLGDSTAIVIARAGAATRDLETVHERPNVLQELTWYPPSTVGRASAGRDSVSSIVFSFMDDQLFKMSVTYDPSRTEGLTREDLIDSLSALYGPRSPLPAPTTRRAGYDSLEVATVLATWRSGDTTITLNEVSYRGSFGLVIVSTAREAAAHKAQAAAVVMDAREAPAREAARAQAEAEAARAAAEKIRNTNKGAFTP
jgi:hypothetical protein